MEKNRIEMLTIKEAAKFTGLPDYTIRQWVITGKLQHVKAGKVYLINKAILLAFLGQPIVDGNNTA